MTQTLLINISGFFLLLYNDVPMEIVSQLLGHSSITITEDSYGKVVKKKVSEQMKRLTDRIN